MSERQVEKVLQGKVFADPFTGRPCKVVPAVVPEPQRDFNKVEILGVELDKETGETHVVVTGYKDIHKEIQECKDDCGYIGMQKLLATGQALPYDFADDGRHGVDLIGVPDNVHDAYRASLASNQEAKEMLSKLGVTVGEHDTQETIEKKITEAVKSKFGALTDKVEKEIKTDEAK